MPLAARATPYVRFGDWVPAASFTLVALAALVAALGAAQRQWVDSPVAVPPPEEPLPTDAAAFRSSSPS
jgi:hypothetical protein